jgi:hypothetical protein
MKKMVATKSMTYRTRRLRAGDEFEANRRDARVLTAIGKAKVAAEPVKRRQARAASAPPIETPGEPEPAPQQQSVAEQPAETDDLGLLTNAELRQIAARESIDVSACKVKADLIDAINAAREEDDV